jgi:hypothetical protein
MEKKRRLSVMEEAKKESNVEGVEEIRENVADKANLKVRDYVDLTRELTGLVKESYITGLRLFFSIYEGNLRVITEEWGRLQIVLASDSKLFLEGLRKVLGDGSGIKKVAEASKRLTEVGVKFLFIDNRAFNLDYGELSDLINKKGSDTKVILLGKQDKNRINILGVIYVTKKTGSSELIHIIKRAAATP